MNRRHLLALVGGAVASWPLQAIGQSSGRIRTIGVLAGLAASDPLWEIGFGALRKGLEELGWTEGQNCRFEIRHAVGSSDQWRGLVAELVRANAEVIVTQSAGLAAITRDVTNTIPIVTTSGDLEGTELVTSLRTPGKNVTGIQRLSPELMGKRLELLKELVPNLNRVGIVKPISPNGIITAHYLEVIAETAQSLGMQTSQISVHGPDEIAPAFATLVRDGTQAALVISNPLALAHRNAICASATQSRMVTIYENRRYIEAGGLISYGSGGIELLPRLAVYVDKILRGARPSELAIEQETKFELVINLRAAKALGLTVPPSLLARADEVIE
jgi:putative ABC transport system substrate-binding protein